ncbi:MAG: MMPL family transporter [Thermodesulfobacteria bacterium]|nr:MMPL family transporter [Thermodesulfobacteriota bacterium]
MAEIKSRIRQLVILWVQMVTRRPLLVALVGVVLGLAAGVYSARNLGVITDTSVMLSKDLGYLKVYRHFKKEFPHSYNQIVILIKGITPDLAMDGRDRLAKALRSKPALFPWVYLPGDDTFFKKNGLLFLSVDELEELADNLAKAQPILARLVEEPNLAGFFSILCDALSAGRNGQKISLLTLFEELDTTFKRLEQGKFYQMSWVRLMTSDKATKATHELILVQPRVNYESMLPGKEAIKTIKEMAASLGLVPEKGITVMLTGDIPMQYDELRSVTQGAKLAGILSLIMVSIVLLTGLGSFRLMFATLFPLVLGLLFTAAFAAWAIGHLNMISVAFAVLFIGLGVDYAIHYCLRYRELLLGGSQSTSALIEAAGDVGPSLVLCAITTSIGFYSFIPTDFSGVAELGLISGTGMFIALFCNFTFLPALISLFPLRPHARQPYFLTSDSHPFFKALIALPYRHSRLIRVVAIALSLVCLFLTLKVRFDSNPINLRDPDAESIRAFKELLKDPNGSPWSLESLAPNRVAARQRKEAFERLPLVRHAIYLESFVPTQQEEKLEVISDMELMLGSLLNAPIRLDTTNWPKEFMWLERFDRELGQSLSILDPEEREVARELDVRMTKYVSRLKGLDDEEKAKSMNGLRKAILGAFPGRMEALRLALSPSRVTLASLPKQLVSQWIGLDGSWRIQVVPAKNPENDQEIMNFINEARKVDKNVTGYPVLIIEGGRAVVRAFKQAFGYSLISILVLLVVLMPRMRDAFVILYSLILAGLLSGAIMALINMPLNFANIIALPLILGIGVDNGIHIVHRYRQGLHTSGSILRTSTARGIFFSTLTTICGFGNLAVSSHVGMASMGKLLTIGITMTLITSVIVIPAFLSLTDSNGVGKGQGPG